MHTAQSADPRTAKPEWDSDIEAVGLGREFEVGTQGWVKPVGAPKTTTRRLSVNAPYGFVVESKLPFCTMQGLKRQAGQENRT